MKKQNNYAFIDGNNLILGLKNQDWKLDYKKLCKFLYDKYRVTKAFWFIGYVPENKKIYQRLKDAGFELIFKKTVIDKFGKIKGNVDVLLTVKCFEELENFDDMILISGDGDFVDLLQAMHKQNKKIKLIVPNKKYMSSLFRNFPNEKIFLSHPNIRNKLEFKQKGRDHCGGRTAPQDSRPR
jgi:uncharacterized LabA/DUF88 family protein